MFMLARKRREAERQKKLEEARAEAKRKEAGRAAPPTRPSPCLPRRLAWAAQSSSDLDPSEACAEDIELSMAENIAAWLLGQMSNVETIKLIENG